MMLCEYWKLIFRLRWLHNWFQMQTFRLLLEPTPSFPLARLPNHKSEHLEHLRNKVIKINVKLLYEVYSPEWAIWLKSYSSFLCYMIIYFSIHLLSLNLVLGSKVLQIQIDGAVWQFPCWVIITLDVFPFFPTGAVLHSQICCKKVVIDRCYLRAPLFSLQASSLTFHIAPAWAVLWFICNCDILTEERREGGKAGWLRLAC